MCPEIRFGVYSAGLKRRDRTHPVIVAGIQSVYQRACELDAFDLILVDEAHLIPPEGDGMYRQFLTDAKVVNPNVRLVGLTATPFRLKTGPICTPDGLLNSICYEAGVRELIRDGYLCPLVTKAGRTKIDTSTLHERSGEFVADETEDLMDHDDLVEAACAEIMEHTANRQACLIFASGIRHGQHTVRVLTEKHGVECGFVYGDTPSDVREALLDRFRTGELKYLCNVNVLTTGFDATNIDCVVLLRPTLSPGLYYQMVGRGFRLHPGKLNCLVLDFGGNVLRHGPVDQIRVPDAKRPGGGPAPAKECPDCHALIAIGYARCPQCGYEFPPRERHKHEAKASDAAVLASQITTTRYVVQDVRYGVHIKRGAAEDEPRSMRVTYKVGWHQYKSEWICFEHEGYARDKAIAWWRSRSPDPVPLTAQEAVDLANCGALRRPVPSMFVASQVNPTSVSWATKSESYPRPFQPARKPAAIRPRFLSEEAAMDLAFKLRKAALVCAELGYPVFPCVPGDKIPLTQHGFKDATTDPDQIERWWDQHPLANIGIATTGLLVVDVDGSSNPWLADKPERLADLACGPVALTANGGRHCVFRQPAGKNWRCTENRLAPKVDTRADGGYIVAPPSVVDGKAYKWALGSDLDCVRESLPEPPAWLVEELDRLGTPTSAQVAVVRRSRTKSRRASGTRRWRD